jgi:[acyl-carrier-protein] S-malonyltransferase
MKKNAFLFPGVGAQYVGMGKTLYDNFKIFRETIEESGDILKKDFTSLCFSPDKKEELDRVEISQLALLTFSTAAYRVYMQEIGIQPHYCMGHSLGEYSALCSAGVIQFSDALELVQQRGLILKEVSAGIDGTMMWVINLDSKTVEDVCQEASKPGQEVYVSAYDSPNQTSISGHTDILMKAAKKLEQKGAIVYPLKLSGPFHSPLMKEASKRMTAVLRKYKYKNPAYPVIANRNALPYPDAESVVDNLSQQLISPIYWRASVEFLLQQEIEIGVEIGPKNVLKFLMAKNTDALRVYTTDNQQDLELISNELLIKEDEYLKIIGKCLGAAVSTKNRNDDAEEYEQKVVKPYRRIESFYKEFTEKGKSPGKDHVKEAMEMLRSILSVKKVPQQEHNYWTEHVLGNKLINF